MKQSSATSLTNEQPRPKGRGICHCEKARPTKQSRIFPYGSGLLRYARNDGYAPRGEELNPKEIKTKFLDTIGIMSYTCPVCYVKQKDKA